MNAHFGGGFGCNVGAVPQKHMGNDPEAQEKTWPEMSPRVFQDLLR